MREFNKRLWDNTACLTSPRLFNCIVNLEGGEKIVQSQADGVAERWNDWLRDFSRSTLLEGASPPLIAGSLITGRVSSQARSRWGWSHSSSPSHPPHWLCGSFLFSSLSVFYEPLQAFCSPLARHSHRRCLPSAFPTPSTHAGGFQPTWSCK